jgi:CheY-like chemotaxis protein
MHGGQVTASSPGIGRGASFEIQLPLAGRARKSPARVQPDDDSQPAERVDLTDHFILVVEDDPATRELLETILVQAGARVKAVDSAAAAVDQLDIEVPSLVLADIGMPEEDGLTMMRRIRKRPPARGGLVRAVALSAYARPQDREAALAAGFDDFLTKPALPIHIVRTIGLWTISAGVPTPGRKPGRSRARAQPAEQSPSGQP